jgi:transcriptional regulator with XRE-family HTH domain
MRIFVERLEQRSQELGLTQAEVARLSQLNERRYNHYARGRRQPDLATLVRVAATLKTTPNWLLGVDGTAPNDERGRLQAQISATCQAMDVTMLGLAATLVTALATHRGKPAKRSTPQARSARAGSASRS